ncbi:hypothetical protein SynROS8604_02776 [Synechococcus sp. ROS8604]|nr:hypothetical protein SynROS8604_02776 [Synechococcus sp. ROS8604]
MSLNAPATTGVFYFFNQHHKPLNQPPIPGTIGIQKAALMAYLAGANKNYFAYS